MDQSKQRLRFDGLFLLFISVFLVSCNHEKELQNETITSKFVNNKANFQCITKFSFENHDYIMFQTSGNYSRVAGIVHNPECKCHDSK